MNNTSVCPRRHNRLLVADAQQKVAAARRMLRAGQRQRYVASR